MRRTQRSPCQQASAQLAGSLEGRNELPKPKSPSLLSAAAELKAADSGQIRGQTKERALSVSSKVLMSIACDTADRWP